MEPSGLHGVLDLVGLVENHRGHQDDHRDGEPGAERPAGEERDDDDAEGADAADDDGDLKEGEIQVRHEHDGRQGDHEGAGGHRLVRARVGDGRLVGAAAGRGNEEAVRRADIVVAALGVAHFVKPSWIKPGAVVLDVGITRHTDADGKATLVGDVDQGVAEVAGYLSPNPGGVGPMTRAMLVKNVVDAAERSLAKTAI